MYICNLQYGYVIMYIEFTDQVVFTLTHSPVSSPQDFSFFSTLTLLCLFQIRAHFSQFFSGTVSSQVLSSSSVSVRSQSSTVRALVQTISYTSMLWPSGKLSTHQAAGLRPSHSPHGWALFSYWANG